MCVQRPFATGGFGCFLFLGCFCFLQCSDVLHVFPYDRFERDIADNVVKQVDWTQEFYPCTLSSRTIVYKGMLTTEQVRFADGVACRSPACTRACNVCASLCACLPI